MTSHEEAGGYSPGAVLFVSNRPSLPPPISASIEFPDVIGTALASVCLSVLSWWVVTHFISDYKRAGLIVTAAIIVIFSFEAFCQQLLKEFQGNFLGDLAVIIFWALLAVGIVFVLSARHLTNQLTYYMNILGALLCCILLMIPAGSAVQDRPSTRTFTRSAGVGCRCACSSSKCG